MLRSGTKPALSRRRPGTGVGGRGCRGATCWRRAPRRSAGRSPRSFPPRRSSVARDRVERRPGRDPRSVSADARTPASREVDGARSVELAGARSGGAGDGTAAGPRPPSSRAPPRTASVHTLFDEIPYTCIADRPCDPSGAARPAGREPTPGVPPRNLAPPPPVSKVGPPRGPTRRPHPPPAAIGPCTADRAGGQAGHGAVDPDGSGR